MQFAKMDVPEEYMTLNDEELVVKMELVSALMRSKVAVAVALHITVGNEVIAVNTNILGIKDVIF